MAAAFTGRLGSPTRHEPSHVRLGPLDGGKKGGYAVQRQYRMVGRDPTAKASRVRQARQGKAVTPRPDYPAHTLSQPPPALELPTLRSSQSSRWRISSVAKEFYRRLVEQTRGDRRRRRW